MATGIVTYHSTLRGLGYIRPNGSNESVLFLDESIINGPLEEEDQVSYDVTEERNYYFADNVRKIVTPE